MTNQLLKELYQRHYGELYAYAYSLCQNHHLAQDLTSDTFYKALLSLEETDYVKFWLFRVSRNLYLDHVKRPDRIAEDWQVEKLTDATTPLDRLLRSEENRDLYHRIIALPLIYREVLVLYYFGGFCLTQIARSQGKSYSSTKTNLFRARRRLQRAMEASDEL